MADNNAGGTVETPSVEELQARLTKAEAKIVEMKKTSTEETSTTQEDEKEDKNTDASTFGKEDVEQLIKAALKEAAIANQEETFEQNQNTTNAMSVGGEQESTGTSFNALDVNEYSRLSNEAQRAYIKSSTDKNGEVVFA